MLFNDVGYKNCVASVIVECLNEYEGFFLPFTVAPCILMLSNLLFVQLMHS